MEFRVLGNELPLGSRRWFEDRVNLHLRFGWQLNGPLAVAAADAREWQKGLGPNRQGQSLFTYQAITHTREHAHEHLRPLAEEARALLAKEEAHRSVDDKRRLKDLLKYMAVEMEYHPDAFPEKEALEDEASVRMSRERLKKLPDAQAA